MVLWLLMLRGISLEFRSHVRGPVWTPLCDAVFCGSSALLAIFFGAALGNVVRGVPLDASGSFFEPLWTNFRLGSGRWHSRLVHDSGRSHRLLRPGPTRRALADAKDRGRHGGTRAAPVAYQLGLRRRPDGADYLFSFQVQPHILAISRARPWGLVFPGLAIAGLAGVRWWTSPKSAAAGEFRAFLSSCAYLAGMLTSVTFGLFPLVLPARGNPAFSLTIENAKAGDYGLKVGLIWWVIGIALASAYFVFVYRYFAGKASASRSRARFRPRKLLTRRIQAVDYLPDCGSS